MTGMEVLITDIEGSRCPIEPQVERKSNVDKGMKDESQTDQSKSRTDKYM